MQTQLGPQLHGVSLPAAEPVSSMQWYVKHFGFDVYMVEKERIVLGLAGSNTVLWLLHCERIPQAKPAECPLIQLQIEGVEAFRDQLVLAGLKPSELVHSKDELAFLCSDPDGNAIRCFSIRP
ncbi:hypothetical protein DNH61_06365 [Paenibacillus sambharensis]|uniref:Glyoxalase/fosfomycin resistance/dioxygenase domain-containing protein n=1 Tax=Paenibacillus sambharensis TaxID=1803190 RepID=A0A2W1L9E0_9BACL|nr:VOC family protein [Paenibacillus sambharensis]PZD96818.1 hypothetical protein DNH61_06365 [Paenibacillus sambharensis]